MLQDAISGLEHDLWLFAFFDEAFKVDSVVPLEQCPQEFEVFSPRPRMA